MREHLFRGKRHDNGEWVEGLPCYGGGLFPDTIETMAAETFSVIPETVGEYTGLTDKNGKKIFEGDIVIYQFDNDDCAFPNKDTKKRIGIIFFSEFRASFSITAGRNGSDDINDDLFRYVRNGNRVEVVGNIHDNPELLTEQS